MTRRQLILGTRNAHKAREIREIFGQRAPVEIVTPDDLGIEPDPAEDAVERYDTFRENAIAKAWHFAERSGAPALADDSGLVVDALDGAPGVRTKRFAEDAGVLLPGEDFNTANNALLLERLDGVPAERRSARFVCVAALAVPVGAAETAPRGGVVRTAEARSAEGLIRTFVGTCSGRIADAPRGEGGFGYDPVFLVPALGRTTAEMDPAEKNRFSHRGRAFRAVASQVGTLFAALDRPSGAG